MKKSLVLFIVASFAFVACSSEQYPVSKDGTKLVVVKHKTSSGTTKKHHKNKSNDTSEANADS
jgi:uncharacterized protein YcfL